MNARSNITGSGSASRLAWAAGAVFGLGLGALSSAAAAGLVADGQAMRSISFSLRDGKPMIEATIAGRQGVLMFDNGTPDSVFLNRDALPLGPGKPVGRGRAASGQEIAVESHAAPPIGIAGQPLVMPGAVRSGNFGFTSVGLGEDFLGFIGTPMVEQGAFVLDFAKRRLTLLKVDANGALPLPGPQHADVLVEARFLLWPGEQPTVAASLGGMPILTDFDTGDGGTLYISPATRARLLADGVLEAQGDQWRLRGLALGGVLLESTLVNLVEAGGPQDLHRKHGGQPDQLRLGAAFLARHASLWNFPARTITFFKPGAAFLGTLEGGGVEGLEGRRRNSARR